MLILAMPLVLVMSVASARNKALNRALNIVGEHEVLLEQDGYEKKSIAVEIKDSALTAVNDMQVASKNYEETAFGVNMQMVYVAGGAFMMGCTSEQPPCGEDVKNAYLVIMDGYYIGKFEVTQGQWEKVMGTSIYQQRDKAYSSWKISMSLYGVGSDYPMYYVSWEDATAFCEELSRKTGKKYRLPTEEQWEYAARDGNRNGGSKYSGSSSADMVAWSGENSGGHAHPVGTKRSNLLGIHDMSGNVSEWCRDWFVLQDGDGDPATASYWLDRIASQLGYVYRAVRGGGCWDTWKLGGVSARGALVPDFRDFRVGFRVVCEP